MELQDSIGRLPAEVMRLIIHMTPLQAMASIWLSSRFWRKNLAPVMEHPKILLVKHSEDRRYREVFMLKNGRYSVLKFRNLPGILACVTIKQSWFNSVHDLEEFKSKFTRIINGSSGASNANSSFFMKVKSGQTEPPLYYSATGFNGFTTVDENAQETITKLIGDAEIISPKPRSTSDGNGIWLYVAGSKPSTWSDIFVHPNGDFSGKTRTSGGNHRVLDFEFSIRTSPAVFKQLEKVVVYSKHRTELVFGTAGEILPDFSSTFDLQYVMNQKRYFVQQCTIDQNGEQILKTNGFRSGSIKKIVQIFEAVLFNKSIECPYKGEVNISPPTFAGHQLIRVPHYKISIGDDLPSVIAVTVTTSSLNTFTLDLQSNLPLSEIIDLFREIEGQMNVKATKQCLYSIDVGGGVRIKHVKVITITSVSFIWQLPKQLIIKVWDALVRSIVK